MGANYDTDKKNRQARIDKETEHKRLRDISDMQKMLKLPEFRRYMWKLMGDAGLFRSSFSQNAMTMSCSEGRRDIGLGILNDLNNADVNVFGQIQREYISEQKSKEALEQKEREAEDDGK